MFFSIRFLGVASVINHTSELFAYFFLHELIHRFGHIKILYLGLLGNFVRFVYISIITNPWWVLPFEFIQGKKRKLISFVEINIEIIFLGLTHAAVWATACSYLSQAAPESLRLSCQGVLQGFHFGFGRGCGALFGGFFASYFGTDITFRAYGVICLILLGLFVYLNHRYQQQAASGYGQNLNVDDPHQFVGNSPLLAPHGAPTNPKWQTKFSSGEYFFTFSLN
jgi:MFS family permease